MSDRQIEIYEAVNAGQRALESLYDAREELQRARNWGIADLLGGGMFITYAKHNKINQAKNCIARAQQEMNRFGRQINDVDAFAGVDLGISDFLVFADYFFDGFVADFMVQQKINEAAGQVDEAIRRVEQLLARLKRM